MDALLAEPRRFGFFQAARLLERLAAGRSGAMVGGDSPPEAEPVRFRAQQGRGFPANEVVDLKANGSAVLPAEMTVGFMGLTGPMGVLPHHYTDAVARTQRERSPALRDFFGIFEHRAVSLFLRAWEKYRPAVQYERHDGAKDPVSSALFALVGLGLPALRGRLDGDDERLLFFSGLMARQPRSAASLETLLGAEFNVPVRVAQLQGRWLYLPDPERTRLARRPGDAAAHARLGMDAIAGERVWDVESHFTIVVGPLDRETFERFLPGANLLDRLLRLTRFFVGQALDVSVRLVLRADEVPECGLSPRNDHPPRLGLNTWLRGDAPFVREADDAVIG
ncbi:MAG: type VI secretion system baseplate subunit TssG [Alphaproteobacteria bacterium]|nr:type VI secretion system baseplate subunit TssG [Alphaproteobacteria bacterium]